MSLKNLLKFRNVGHFSQIFKIRFIQNSKFCTDVKEKSLIKSVELGVKQVATIEENDFLKELKDPDSVLFKQALPIQSFSLAPYVNSSVTLQNLVKLGVDLHAVEEDTDLASHLARADFKQDIQPLILFLHDNDIPADLLGHVFTKNPAIFREPLEKLQLRIDYLISKKFSREAIARIVSKIPDILTTSTILTDRQLGFLQIKFKLSGDEVRNSVTKFPKIVIWDSTLIQVDIFQCLKLYLIK